MTTPISRQEPKPFGEDVVSAAFLGACAGVVTFVVFGFVIESITLSFFNGALLRNIGFGIVWVPITLLIFGLPVTIVAMVLLGVAVATGYQFEIRRATFYCAAGIATSTTIVLPIFWKVAVGRHGTGVVGQVDLGFKIILAGLLAGLVLWKRANKRFASQRSNMRTNQASPR
ncbi:hypothetical protein [Paraburkholderia adhaesiva]|uniref:hypothetical protein n=1 Tax=Paraburkholderia adhaesiva TaxID=2883244 RepID=UPI001F2E3319|nr:hypothetical protein [Paraburkholderia adhaesiva]